MTVDIAKIIILYNDDKVIKYKERTKNNKGYENRR